MILLFIIFSIIILNPYTVIGPLGYYAVLPLIGCSFLILRQSIGMNVLFSFMVLIFISLLGLLSSAIHGITQVEHVKVAVLIFVYFCTGVGLFYLFKNKIDFNDYLVVALCVGIFNGLIILLQVQFSEFRALSESILVEAGNIDWTDGFRYRGLASSGGASLSVLSAVMVFISLYLYGIKRLNLFFACFSLTVLISAVFFIGRTGILLILIAFILYLFTHAIKSPRLISFLSFILIFIVFFGFEFIKSFLIEEYGEGFYRYSLGYFLEGREGFENEGTIKVIADFLKVVPDKFPEIIIGYGFYGGSNFYPWTDSGYARMFLSVGFFWGFSFYIIAFFIFKNLCFDRPAFFWPLIFILALAEVKEGMMFSGYSSRLLFISLGFLTAEKSFRRL
jgi:hypothetical protein